ncbi:MAG TPA: hypothetical protein DEQ47_07390, partial [Solibacterales bacterium]|nr:hypothetical protein [Bryobacterales bacterium]
MSGRDGRHGLLGGGAHGKRAFPAHHRLHLRPLRGARSVVVTVAAPTATAHPAATHATAATHAATTTA